MVNRLRVIERDKEEEYINESIEIVVYDS